MYCQHCVHYRTHQLIATHILSGYRINWKIRGLIKIQFYKSSGRSLHHLENAEISTEVNVLGHLYREYNRVINLQLLRYTAQLLGKLTYLVKYDVTSIIQSTFDYLPTKTSPKYINLLCKKAVPNYREWVYIADIHVCCSNLL